MYFRQFYSKGKSFLKMFKTMATSKFNLNGKGHSYKVFCTPKISLSIYCTSKVTKIKK